MMSVEFDIRRVLALLAQAARLNTELEGRL